MSYTIVQNGDSRSFPAGDSFYEGASENGVVIIYLGGSFTADGSKAAVLVELDTECLGVHTGESMGDEGSNVVGFARYRNGQDAPSDLVELVRQPNTPASAIEAARKVFEDAGLAVAVCSDQAGRIIDRLVRPKYNEALRFLDEGLATAEDIDMTCRMGLGYPDGPIERVVRGDLVRHHNITSRLFEIYGAPTYAPARRAVTAKQREQKK